MPGHACGLDCPQCGHCDSEILSKWDWFFQLKCENCGYEFIVALD